MNARRDQFSAEQPDPIRPLKSGRRVPWGPLGLALGAASFLGVPLTMYAILAEKLAWFWGVPTYGVLVAATAGALLAARRDAKLTAAAPRPGLTAPTGSPDTAMAATGVTLAATGCGAIALFTVALVVLALALAIAVAWWVGRYFLGLW